LDCNRVLIVEDDTSSGFLLKEITHSVLTTADIHLVSSLKEAIPKVPWADLVITDYEYPSCGFLGLLPELQKEKKYFILQSGGIKYLKKYDDKLQIDAIYKGCDNFIHRIKKAIEVATQIQ